MKKLLFLGLYAPTNGVAQNPPPKPRQERQADEQKQVYEALKRLNYNFHSTCDVEHLIECKDEYDLVWSLYDKHKIREFVPSFCRLFCIEYIGSTPSMRTLATDKNLQKQFAVELNIDTAKWITAFGQNALSQEAPFPGPYFVKPRFGAVAADIDASCICETWGDVVSKAANYFASDNDVIIESFIEGEEYSVAVIDAIDKCPIVSAPIDRNNNICTNEYLTKQLQYMAKQYFIAMQSCDYVSVSFIVAGESGIPYFLGVNDMMGFNADYGVVPALLKGNFQTYDDIVRHIVNLGINKLSEALQTKE